MPLFLFISGLLGLILVFIFAFENIGNSGIIFIFLATSPVKVIMTWIILASSVGGMLVATLLTSAYFTNKEKKRNKIENLLDDDDDADDAWS